MRIVTETWQYIADELLTFQDLDGDGIKESFSLTLVGGDTSSIQDYELAFIEVDRLPDPTDPASWLIRPVTKKVIGGNIVFSGPLRLLVLPGIYENSIANVPGYSPGILGVNTDGSIDPENASNLAVSLSVYKKIYTSENKATLVTIINGIETESEINAQIVYKDGGQILINFAACWPNPLTCTCNYQAYSQRLKINYLAGNEPTNRRGVFKNWQTIVSRVALAELRRPICACLEANLEALKWQADVSRAGGKMEEQFRVTDEQLNNPLGTSAGHIYAWGQIKNYLLVRGLAM